jgi:hypothetical protein
MGLMEFRSSNKTIREVLRPVFVALVILNVVNFSILIGILTLKKMPLWFNLACIVLFMSVCASTSLVFLSQKRMKQNLFIYTSDDEIALKDDKRSYKSFLFKDLRLVIVNKNKTGQIKEIELKTSNDRMKISAMEKMNKLFEHIENHIFSRSIIHERITSK